MSKYDSFQGQNAKVVERNDGSGKTDIYYGGPTGDGPGHGHVVVDSSGSCHYWREPYVAHSDYGIDDTKYNHTKF